MGGERRAAAPVQFLVPLTATVPTLEGGMLIPGSPRQPLVAACTDGAGPQQLEARRAVATDPGGHSRYLDGVVPLADPPLLAGAQLVAVQRLGRCTAGGIAYERYEAEIK